MPVNESSITDQSITAVIVTFNPDLTALSAIINSLRLQLNSIVIVDNNSKSQNELAEICESVEFVPLPVNLGLGKAHNLGIEYARKHDSQYVLLLDQDSLPDPGMVQQMLNTADKLKLNGIMFCAVGSRYRDNHGHLSDFVKVGWFRFTRNSCGENQHVEADFLISSGALIPISAINEIGMMDESLFIDHIDTEWFMRANSLGYKSYGCCTAMMRHSLGEKTTRIWLARWRNVPYHNPFRYYYIFRNSLLLYRRGYMPFKWMLADWVRLGQIFLFFGLFAGDRVANLKMIANGVIDGLKGKSGRNDQLTPA